MALRKALQQMLEAVWYGGHLVPFHLALLEKVYRALLALRRVLYRSGLLRSTRLPVPVIVCGNLTAGGTGKTPLVEWLARELLQRGWRPGIVLRGYRARSKRALLLDDAHTVEQVGDEAFLLAKNHFCPVAIGRRRVEAARLLIAADCNIVISDDGLQHWALARDVEILLVDGERRFGNGRLLPAGPLREPLERYGRVDFVVGNGEAAAGEIEMRLVGEKAFDLNNPAIVRPLRQFAGKNAHAVAGIGNPARFFRMLRDAGLVVVEHAYDDHHHYVGDEFDFADESPIFITEKDAVKCAALVARKNIFVVPVQARLPDDFADRIQRVLHEKRQ